MLKARHGTALAALLAMALFASGNAVAQTTSTTEVRNFEVISVVGNQLVVRDELGTREITVPPDFRFTVNGKSLAVSDLKAGMKGTAAVTTTTTSRPVYVTEVKEALVVKRTGTSIIVRDTGTGKSYHFNQKSINDRDIKLFLDERPVKVTDLDAGQKITATIVTAGPPEVLTAKQVEAVLANPDAPIATVVAAPVEAPAAAAPEPAAAEPAAEPAPEPVAEPVQAAEVVPDAAPAESPSHFETLPKPFFKHPFFMLLVFIIVVALVWVLIRRRRKK